MTRELALRGTLELVGVVSVGVKGSVHLKVSKFRERYIISVIRCRGGIRNLMLPDLMVILGLGTESRCSYLGIESRSVEE